MTSQHLPDPPVSRGPRPDLSRPRRRASIVCLILEIAVLCLIYGTVVLVARAVAAPPELPPIPADPNPRIEAILAQPSPQREYTPAAAMFRECCRKALAGEFGKLRPWQEAAYTRGYENHRTYRARLTVYGPWEGYDRNEGCAYGYGCSEEIAASNTLPARTVIWIPQPAHLRVIGDTGAASNARNWVDLWIPYKGWRGLQNTVYHRDIIIIGR